MAFYMFFVGYFNNNVQTVNSVFVQAFNYKSIETISYIECNNQLMDYAE